MACESLIVVGGGVQVVGFGLTLRQSVVTRREQSPDEISLASWTGARLRSKARATATWLRVTAEPLLRRLHLIGPHVASGEARITAGGNISAWGHKAINNRERPTDERVDRLEDAVNELYRDHSEHRRELNERMTELQRAADDREAARETERARHLGRRLRAEEAGVLVFVLGIGLTTWGALT